MIEEKLLKTMRMENSFASTGPPCRPFRLWTDIPMEERVHVQGIPGVILRCLVGCRRFLLRSCGNILGVCRRSLIFSIGSLLVGMRRKRVILGLKMKMRILLILVNLDTLVLIPEL